jgi:hypothetical protein
MQTRRNDLLDKLCFWILTRRRRNFVTKTHHELDSPPRGVRKGDAAPRKGTPFMDMGHVTCVINKFATLEDAVEK